MKFEKWRKKKKQNETKALPISGNILFYFYELVSVFFFLPRRTDTLEQHCPTEHNATYICNLNFSGGHV